MTLECPLLWSFLWLCHLFGGSTWLLYPGHFTLNYWTSSPPMTSSCSSHQLLALLFTLWCYHYHRYLHTHLHIFYFLVTPPNLAVTYFSSHFTKIIQTQLKWPTQFPHHFSSIYHPFHDLSSIPTLPRFHTPLLLEVLPWKHLWLPVPLSLSCTILEKSQS